MGSAGGGMHMGALEFLDIITPEEASTLVSELAPVPFFPGLQSSFRCLQHKNIFFHTARNKWWSGGFRTILNTGE